MAAGLYALLFQPRTCTQHESALQESRPHNSKTVNHRDTQKDEVLTLTALPHCQIVQPRPRLF